MRTAHVDTNTLPRFGPAHNVLSRAIVAVLFVGLACGQGGDSARKTSADPLAALFKVPKSMRMRQNPYAGDLREQTAGGKLFEQHCAQCHGENAAGTRRAPSLSSSVVQKASPGTLFSVITNGVVRRGMPVWSKLPEQQRWQIVTFLKSLNSRPGRATEGP